MIADVTSGWCNQYAELLTLSKRERAVVYADGAFAQILMRD